MTDQEYANRVHEAVKELNEAVLEASRHNISVDLTSVEHHNMNTPFAVSLYTADVMKVL